MVKVLAVFFSAMAILSGCNRSDSSVAPAADHAATAVPGGCDRVTLANCTEEQKAMIRMSGSGLKK